MPLGRSVRRDPAVPETVPGPPCSAQDSCGHPCRGRGRLPGAVPAEEGVGEGDELAYDGDEGSHVRQAARFCVATVGAAVAAQGGAAQFESGGQPACVGGRVAGPTLAINAALGYARTGVDGYQQGLGRVS